MSTQKILTGFHAVTSRLRQRPETVTEIYLDADRSDARAKDLRELAKRLNVRLISADMKRLDGMANGVRHQGVIAHAEPLDTPKFIEDVLEAIDEPPLLLILDGVQDPHNLGACLRVADGVGAHAVIAPKDRSVGLTTDDESRQSLYKTKLEGALGLVLGAEGEGLRRLTKETCDLLVSIPMMGSVESLNVSVASGVCLYEARRQRLK